MKIKDVRKDLRHTQKGKLNEDVIKKTLLK